MPARFRAETISQAPASPVYYARVSTADLRYQSGFGNDFASEALPGALPIGQSNPQRPAYGLYTEEINGTSFTAPRASSRRCWTYRIRPSAVHEPYEEISAGLIRSAPFDEATASPNQLRWRPLPLPSEPTHIVAGHVTMGGNGDPAQQSGAAVHLYAAYASMTDRFF
jgi:homogentisate 1,2-dioxygenase